MAVVIKHDSGGARNVVPRLVVSRMGVNRSVILLDSKYHQITLQIHKTSNKNNYFFKIFFWYFVLIFFHIGSSSQAHMMP